MPLVRSRPKRRSHPRERVNLRSFDAGRDRVVPTELEGRWSSGAAQTIGLNDLALIVAVKSDCFGCRDFVQSDPALFDSIQVVVISTTEDEKSEWERAPHQVLLVDQAVFDSFDIRWPPFYVLVNGKSGHVLCEGVVFGPSQVAEEIAPFLN